MSTELLSVYLVADVDGRSVGHPRCVEHFSDRRARRKGPTRWCTSLPEFATIVIVMTVLPHVLVLVVLFCAVTLTGCREKGAASPAVDSGPARAKPRVADNPQTLSEEPAVLTERQRQAFDSIVSAGGGIDQDADGHAVGIDLASDRVLADEATVRAVLEFPHLKRLHLAVSKVSQKTLAGLASLRELEELLLQDAPLDDAALAKLLLAAPDLQRLTLRRLSQVTDAGLSALPECKELEVVALIEMSGITGAALDALRRVERMRSLDVRNCGQLTTADFAQLASLPALAELKVGGPAVNDEVLSILAKHPALTSLSVDDAQISAACLQQLAGSPEMAGRLRSLSFARCFGVTDESLQALREFPMLETLALREIMLTGSFLQSVQDAADEPLPLKTLIVTNAFLTDESLTPLPGLCPALTRLDVSGNQGVTDIALGILKQLPVLREVRLERTGVTQPWHPRENTEH